VLHPSTLVRRWRALLLLTAFLAASLTVLLPAATAPAEAATGHPVMRDARLSAPQLATWFRSSPARVAGYRASVDVETLARLYIEEGRAEGVAGDVAFVQAVLETGSFRWPSYGQVAPTHNNFAGIGACDGGTCTVARFKDARTGVRAQIHHLRAYADPAVTRANLANPLESPRFDLVTPKGRAPQWEQYGCGNWATDPAYAPKILDLYDGALRHAGLAPGARSPLACGASTVSTSQRFTDVPAGHTHARAIEALAASRISEGCTTREFCPSRTVTRAQVATFVTRAKPLPAGPTSTFRDATGPHRAGIEAAAAADVTRGCTPTRFCPQDPVTRGQLASMLQRALGLPARPNRFRDVPAGHTHAGAIGALAEAGIALGNGDGTYSPNRNLTRGQMASLLQRAFLR
jgi:hypothetical protein